MSAPSRARTTPGGQVGWYRVSQERRLAGASFVSWAGYGMYAPGSLLFLTKVADVSIVYAGLAQTAGMVCGLLVSVPAGRVIDVVGPHRMAVMSYGLQAVLLLAMSTASPLMAILMVILQAIAAQMAYIALGAVVAELPNPDRRTRVSALLQSANNLGFMAGALLFGAIVTAGASTAYTSCVIGYAVAQALCAALLPRTKGGTTRLDQADERAPTFSVSAIKDIPYLVMAVMCGLMMISDAVLIVGIPLWIAGHPNIPTIFTTLLIVLNTGIVILLQMRFSRAVDSRQAAVRRLRLSGLLIATACLLFGASGLFALSAAPTFLIIGAVVLTLGELIFSPAKWFLRYNLARESAQGEYGGVFGMAVGAGAAIGPVLIAGLIAGIGSWAWPILTVGFLIISLLTSISVPPRAAGRKPAFSDSGRPTRRSPALLRSRAVRRR
ncbi:MFS transporter [Nonomuraea sp. NPDC050643]|uniref:MFS transporter n=1 Tax=Nonomuraea sp. NPDC050643 TaxID=3155660 RepID=UPI0033D2838F